MNRIASPSELTVEIRSLVASIQQSAQPPSRQVIAEQLRRLAERVAYDGGDGVEYGEVHRKTEDNVTIVVRKIFHARKGDSFHVRVLKGKGKESDESKQGEILFRSDEKSKEDAIKAAKDWIKSPKGKAAVEKLGKE